MPNKITKHRAHARTHTHKHAHAQTEREREREREKERKREREREGGRERDEYLLIPLHQQYSDSFILISAVFLSLITPSCLQ